jgi:hypothetical protein
VLAGGAAGLIIGAISIKSDIMMWASNLGVGGGQGRSEFQVGKIHNSNGNISS